jgi:quinol monooxygenase YgiN
LLYENWDSRELRVHRKAPHLAAYLEATEGGVAEFTLTEVSHIG